jgi:hypothetical protein
MPKLIDVRVFSFGVILSEVRDPTQGLPSHIVLCVTSASIVRFLAPLGMTMERVFAHQF